MDIKHLHYFIGIPIAQFDHGGYSNAAHVAYSLQPFDHFLKTIS